MASIRYYLPEDGDHEDTPNVFLSPKPSRPGYPPLLGQIKGSFPLPGSYHFRFKTALVPGTDRDKNALAVWMDCVDDSQPVPVWQNSIIAKVTRISLDDDDEFDEDFASAGVSRAESNVSAVSAASMHSAQPKPITESASTHSMHSSDSLLGAFDDPPAPAAPAASAASSVHSSTANLLDVDNHPPAPASGGSLLDMDHLGSAHRSGANTPTSVHNDLLNMSAPMPSQPRPTHPAQGGAMPAPVQQRQPPMQQGRPPQQAPMQGQYPMQYPPQRQNAAHGMQQMPAPQQQQQQQRNQQNGASGKNNAFDQFSDPLGNLNWG
mmetsp:Transcript_5698/g.12932  ORF Transcript_5698/g.12932 Transcript_5698/m.12932 type:complete len:321 (-) Transcript_5698:136-1098(-)|eukprot:CAMPEP_0172311512 /NCGR_PEP_ID=MMETSP1058-20130122/14945_1 /TAXON_ID=83371 /ORGANISM="Detonula confervacea, Strain CCMP 353" /LENGTH=320 /DNA_ID=CAMNT_0013024709 /DNA_START=63 /DNA_END=1025 /DNA_ORIENTATION=+